MESPAATTKTATGTYCKTCGYDLRASGEAGRCPECGRVFSPGDPKSFRNRPFAAPWKRALGRWAKRAAILLLGLVVLLGGTWGWFYWGWRQEQAVVTQVGGAYLPDVYTEPRNFWAIAGGRPGCRLWIWLVQHDLAGGRVLERVHHLILQPTPATDLLPLRNLPELQALTIYGSTSDAGLAALVHCRRLRKLRLRCSGVGAAGLAALRDLPRLEELELFRSDVPRTALGSLAGLAHLQDLDLDRVDLTDADLVHLESLRNLRVLNLDSTRVTDAGLVHLQKLAALETLDLCGTKVSDAGLVHLEELRRLRELDLRYTQVTPAGVERLRAALPGCSIDHGP